MKRSAGISRRELVLASGAVGLALGCSSWAAALVPTPQQTAGPFYPRDLPLDHDNNLVMIEGHAEKAQGTVADVFGRLLDLNGQPIGRAQVEIWQCDATGRYHHPADRRRQPRDEHFQGFGKTTTDAQGRYRFRTIRPVPYPGRTPHIHFRVLGDEFQTLTTQLYIAGHPQNDSDGIFRSLGDRRQQAALARFVPTDAAGVDQQAHFDIILEAV